MIWCFCQNWFMKLEDQTFVEFLNLNLDPDLPERDELSSVVNQHAAAGAGIGNGGNAEGAGSRRLALSDPVWCFQCVNQFSQFTRAEWRRKWLKVSQSCRGVTTSSSEKFHFEEWKKASRCGLDSPGPADCRRIFTSWVLMGAVLETIHTHQQPASCSGCLCRDDFLWFCRKANNDRFKPEAFEYSLLLNPFRVKTFNSYSSEIKEWKWNNQSWIFFREKV